MKVRPKKRRPTANALTVNPFVSEKQRAWMHANDPAMAKRWEEHTPKGKKLPKRKPNRIATNKLKLRANKKAKKKPSVKASRLDPTKTVTMRRAFCAKIKRQFALLKGRIVKLLVDEDAFGLKEREPFTVNRDLRAAIEAAASEADPDPSPEQKEAGNYRKGHVTVQGLPITIEVAAGNLRRGKSYVQRMAHHYGYIKRTESEADGDHVDVFLGPHPESEVVFIIDQKRQDGTFDEHKCMVGFTNAKDAKKAYHDNYSEGWTGFDGMKAVTMSAFKHWIGGSGTGMPIRDQVIRNWSPDQPRDEHGRWGEGGEFGSLEGEGRISFSGMLTGLKAVGTGAAHIEHLAKSYAADGIGKAVSSLPDHLPHAVNATYGPLAYAGKMGISAAFAVFTSTQALAERTARERGHTPEQAKQLRGVLSKIDLGTFEAFKFSAIAGVHAAHLPALVTGTLPVASVGYLAYSTARDPLATIRAATGLVKEAAGKVSGGVKRYLIHNSEQENAATVAMALEAHGFNDWYYALLSAALDETGGVMQAIDLAHDLYEKHPKPMLTTNAREFRTVEVPFRHVEGTYSLVVNTRWMFHDPTDKVKAFQAWLKRQTFSLISNETEEERWKRYIQEGFAKGAGRAFDDVRMSKLGKEHPELFTAEAQQSVSDFYRGTREEFLRSSFAQPESIEKVRLLADRTFDELKNVTEDMSNKCSRALTDGLVQGKHPLEIAGDLEDEVGFSEVRAEAVARTEIIRAHAEGQLDAMEDLGVQEVGVAVEWSTAGDDHVCFPAWTLVETEEGEVPIQDILVGMKVRTRGGWRAVLKTFVRDYEGPMTTVLTAVGRNTSTANHPFWTSEQGWTAAGKLRLEQTLQTVGNELADILGIINFRFGDSVDAPSQAGEARILPGVPLGVSMPVGAVGLNSDHRVWEQEVHREPADSCLLDVSDAEPVKCEPYHSLKRGFMARATVASERAKAPLGVGWNSPKFSAAGDALLDNWRTATLFGAMFPHIATAFITAAQKDSLSAGPAPSVFASLGFDPALDRTICVSVGSRAIDSEGLTAAEADLSDLVLPRGLVTRSGAEAPIAFDDRTSPPMDLLPTNRARMFGTIAAGQRIAPMGTEPARAGGLLSRSMTLECLAALVADELKATLPPAFEGTRERAIALLHSTIESLSASIKTCAASGARELKRHCYALLTESDVIGHSLLGIPLPVYNIQVEDEEEFYANGVLVHNCEECSPMEGVVLSIDDAHGMIPAHVNCRCAFLPANVGEDDSDQKRTKEDIEEAAEKSGAKSLDDFEASDAPEGIL